MNDDQVLELLRDVDLPGDPADRYDQVIRRRRRADGRRLSLVGAGLAVVLVVSAVSVVTLRRTSAEDPTTLFAGRPSSARIVTTLTMDGKTSRTETQIDYLRPALVVRMSAAPGQPAVEFLRQIGKDTWLRVPAPLPSQPDKHWLHTDTRVHSLEALRRQGDPFDVVESIRREGGSLRPTGSRVIDGVSTSRYVVTGFPKDDDADLRDVVVYVDKQGRLRRLEASIGGAPGTRGSFVSELSDFGAPVRVEPPPASEVAESTQGGGAFSSCSVTVDAPDAQVETATVRGCESMEVTATTPVVRQQLCDKLTRKANIDTRMTQEQRDQVIAAACEGVRP